MSLNITVCDRLSLTQTDIHTDTQTHTQTDTHTHTHTHTHTRRVPPRVSRLGKEVTELTHASDAKAISCVDLVNVHCELTIDFSCCHW